ncbi:hypothetical protein [Actinopolymorpha pittospori]|uniref:Precorrin-2 methylase n=1 Tax=Actinopolymorpha pittospori TaxID=648752 RepID=A0A927N0G7_9ACTN|nr:hypothetical protein [Actinopolymorpha pittospori]MBE1608053.1 precorrin-2 methylase [Actinopolymorpha pittospori]
MIRKLLSIACWTLVVTGMTAIITELARGSIPISYGVETLFVLVCAMALWTKPKREQSAGEEERNT